jgi:methyl-accepting chemotaxis protein
MCDNKDLCLKAPSTSKDEIGQVSQKFNFLFAILNETIIDAKAASKNSVKISEEFGVAISKIQKRSEEESNLVGIASKKGSEVGEILKDYEIKTAENYKMTKEAHGELESVREDVVTLVQNVQSGAQVENVLAEKLNELSHEADQVKDVLVIISDIADQTNLLALNAAIEAARAGEHGRGFAVVADEVRKLAERTQKSLSEINATVNVIVQSIMDASDAMNKNAKEIEKVSQSSALVEDKISKTSETMNTTMINVDSFTESFVTIKENISTLLTDVAGVDKLSKENVESVQEMAQTANHLRSQSSDLNEKLEVFKN